MITDGSRKNSTFSRVEEYFKLDNILGLGAYSKVRLAIEVSTGRNYAIKIIDSIYHNIKVKNKFLKRELEALERINHNNVIKYYNYATYSLENELGYVEPHDCILLEYAENGCLFDFLFSEKKGFGEKVAKHLFNQIINGVEACHNFGIAHGDIKAENVLFHRDWTIKLCDFGNSYPIGGKNVDIREGTTKSYCAPEVWNNDKNEILSSKSDIFSCGVLLFLLVTANFPFLEASNSDIFYRRIKSKKISGMWESMNSQIACFENISLSSEFKDLFLSLVQFDPKERPSIEEIKKSKWLNVDMATSIEVFQELEKRKKYIKSCI